MQEEWYEPSPRDKRWAEAFFATQEGKKALKRYEKIINSVSRKKTFHSDVLADYQKYPAK